MVIRVIGTIEKRMPKVKPFGVRLIAILFFLEASALISAAVIGLSVPRFQSGADAFIMQRIPFLKAFEYLNVPRLRLAIAPLFALVSLAEGLGIWFLSRAARTLIVYDLTWRLGVAFVAAVLLGLIDRQMLSSIVSTPQFLVGLVVNIFVLKYLLDPDTRMTFGVPEHESD